MRERSILGRSERNRQWNLESIRERYENRVREGVANNIKYRFSKSNGSRNNEEEEEVAENEEVEEKEETKRERRVRDICGSCLSLRV